MKWLKNHILEIIFFTSLVVNALLIIAFSSNNIDLGKAIDRIDDLEIENKGLRKSENINLEKIEGLVFDALDHDREIERLGAEHTTAITEKENEIQHYESLPVFEDLRICQDEFDSVIMDFEKFIKDTKVRFSLTIENHDKVMLKMQKALNLHYENYTSASKRATNNMEQRDLYKKIAESKIKKWGWFAGAGAYFGYDFNGERKAGVAFTIAYGRSIGGNKKYKKALRAVAKHQEIRSK